MARDTYVVLVRRHDNEADALADLAGLIGKPNGKVNIFKRVEEPIRQGGAIGWGVGLAVGAMVVLFRPAALNRAARILGDVIEAGAGAVAGHAVRRIKQFDLKHPGHRLDKGNRGRPGIAALAVEAIADAALTPTKHRTKKPATARLQGIIDAVKQDIDRQEDR